MRLPAVLHSTLFIAVIVATPGVFGQTPPSELAAKATGASARPRELVLILNDQPVAAKFAQITQRNSFAAQSWRAQLRTAQATVKQRLATLKVPVTGSAELFLNGVFVTAAMDQVAALQAIPGVQTVALAPRLHRTLDRAIDLQNVRQAWTAVGGVGNAGAGVKIAVIDSGLDQTHPAFQDATLTPPAGFPKGDAAFTNSKVIAARSYVSLLSSPDVRYDTPDDNTPRDHVGHGTALAMIAAGNTVKAPVATITGIAPKAFLGNYKIFGSPGINDTTTTAVLVQALEDAYTDGMDIAVLSLGYAAFGSPLDMSSSCQQTPLRSYIPATACDVNAYVVEHAVSAGMVMVVSAGNDGCSGLVCPTLGTINSPGTAPSAITVGSTTNAHMIFSRVRANGQTFNGVSGNGPRLNAPLTARVVDVTTLGNDGNACAALPANSLTGAIALVTRGTCNFFVKVNSAQAAGAVAVVMYDTQSDNIFQPTFLLNETALPLEYVGITAGAALKSAAAAKPDLTATLDPTLFAVATSYDTVANNSSRGPTIGNTQLKPEIAAVGSNVYTATQNYDISGDSYDVSRYTSVDGTSFAAAMVTGAAALVKQAHPGYTAAQIKSALVNTATAGVVMDTATNAVARATAVGAGKLDAGAAVASNVVVSPQVISIGLLGSTLPGPIALSLTNSGATPVTLALSVARRDADGNNTMAISPSALTLNAGQSQTATLNMTGRAPNPGTYEGQINITGGAVPVHVPYHYITSDKAIGNVYPVAGDYYFAVVSEYPNYIYMRVTDRFGAPVAGAPVQWSALDGGAVDYRAADVATDSYGIAGATIQQGSTPGFYGFQGVTSGNYGWEFTQSVNYAPSISGGIYNAGSLQTGSLAPGSYATLSGVDFASVPIIPKTPYLPVSLGNVSVSFDAGGVSVPAPVSYMSYNQINLQIPWELAGQSSASVKVTYHGIAGPPVTVPLAAASPAFFEYTDSTNNQLSAVAQDLNYRLITSQNAAVRGQPVVLYANGLGPVTNTPATGAQASATSLSRTTSLPVVTIGGQPAQVLFSGLTPQIVSLYQLNIVVPPNTPAGLQPLTVSINGVASKTSMIAVK